MPDQLDRLKTALADRYSIERELGAGGMATVYLADDPRHHRKVALKVLRPDLAATLGPERFLREVTIAANLQHPHILPVYDSGEADGFLYYVMPSVEGESLRDRLRRERELPVAEAVRILRDVADAMAAAHAKEVVHRDIKPENVMISGRHALVTDFGVAKAVSEATGRQQLTTAGVALGTPTYMAPEQAAADPHADHRADIYAFGVMAYEMLTGQPPFVGASPQAVLAAHWREEPALVTAQRPAIPPPLAQLIMRCLEKKPADRPQRAEDVLAVLEGVATPSGGITPAETRPARATGRPVPRRAATFVVAILGVAGLTVGGYALWRSRTPSDLNDDRVAVIRFENRTGIDSLGTLGLILADAITSDLNRSGVVEAVPTMSVGQLVQAATAGGVPLDPGVIGRETRAGLVVTGSYYLQGDSLAVQAEVVDVARDRTAVPVPLVLAPTGDTRAVLDRTRQRVQVALAARTNSLLRESQALLDLPVSLDAYQKYADGLDRYVASEYAEALRLFYDALAADPGSVTLQFWVALTEWNANTDVAKTDSLLRLLEPRQSEMAPLDRAYYDFLRGWLDGDLEGALRGSRRIGELSPLWAGIAAADALRANRVDESRRRMEQAGRSAIARRTFIRHWQLETLLLHWTGEFTRELDAVQRGREEFGNHVGFLRWEIRALAALGRGDELLDRLEALHAEDPGSGWFWEATRELVVHGHAPLADSVGRRAVEWYRAELERDSTPSIQRTLATALFYANERAESRVLFEDLLAAIPNDRVVLAYLGVIAARDGDTAGAERAIERLRQITTPYIFGNHLFGQGVISAALGQCERAVGYLREATQQGTPYDSFMDGRDIPTALLEPLAECPAFKRFVEPKG